MPKRPPKEYVFGYLESPIQTWERLVLVGIVAAGFIAIAVVGLLV